MGNTIIVPKMKGTFKYKLRKKMPFVLAIASSAGVVLTAILTHEATIKAIELKEQRKDSNMEESPKEEIIDFLKIYGPAIGSGITTILFIFGATGLNRKQQMLMSNAYNFLNTSFNEYRKKIRELYGDEIDQNIIDSITIEKNDNPYLCSNGLGLASTLSIVDSKQDEVSRLFFDTISNRCFESTLSDVLQAEYHLNRNFVIGGVEYVNTFHEFLGLPVNENYENYGWSMLDGIGWIDINHEVKHDKNGNEIIAIKFIFAPEFINEE